MAKANGICCSIEMEPKTLREDQLNHAREVAADVVQKLEHKEATTIFTEGLRPMIGAMEMKLKIIEDMRKDELPCELGDCIENAQIVERPCQCSIITPLIAESPDVITEPLSAPF